VRWSTHAGNPLIFFCHYMRADTQTDISISPIVNFVSRLRPTHRVGKRVFDCSFLFHSRFMSEPKIWGGNSREEFDCHASARDLQTVINFSVQEDRMSETYQAETQIAAAFLGDMYARWTLDCLIEIAHSISDDYFSNPEFYQGTGAPDDIIDLWLSYGSVRNFPNKVQRQTLAASIFGASDGYLPTGGMAAPTGGMAAPTGGMAAPTGGMAAPTGGMAASTRGMAANDAFHQNRAPLFKACIAAQTATSAESRDGLNQQVVQALPNFQSYLGGFPGKAARVAYEQIKAVSQTSFAVLRSDAVSSRFIGSHAHISEDWPLQKSDPNGDKLVAECAFKFKAAGADMSKDFPSLRSLARAGKEALESIVQPTTALDDLISKTYSWAMFTGMYEPYTGKQ
jgi:hypothetical protein